MLPVCFYCFFLSVSQGARAFRCRIVRGGPDQYAIQPLKQPRPFVWGSRQGPRHHLPPPGFSIAEFPSTRATFPVPDGRGLARPNRGPYSIFFVAIFPSSSHSRPRCNDFLSLDSVVQCSLVSLHLAPLRISFLPFPPFLIFPPHKFNRSLLYTEKILAQLFSLKFHFTSIEFLYGSN